MDELKKKNLPYQRTDKKSILDFLLEKCPKTMQTTVNMQVRC